VVLFAWRLICSVFGLSVEVETREFLMNNKSIYSCNLFASQISPLHAGELVEVAIALDKSFLSVSLDYNYKFKIHGQEEEDLSGYHTSINFLKLLFGRDGQPPENLCSKLLKSTPNRNQVSSAKPEFEGIALEYHDGKIVKVVDGTALAAAETVEFQQLVPVSSR
jgi:hypothetical protein